MGKTGTPSDDHTRIKWREKSNLDLRETELWDFEVKIDYFMNWEVRSTPHSRRRGDGFSSQGVPHRIHSESPRTF